jgi:ABC-type multidrug transport system ATPase subunit
VRRQISLVGHQSFCYDDLSALENLHFAARAAGRTIAAADAALERLELTRVAKVVHGRLSAGQQRRLALAIALARDPRLMLLDEPHAGLDTAGRELLDTIVAAAPGEGRTVVIASHELERARALSHREVRVVAGRAAPVASAAPAPSPPVQSPPVQPSVPVRS